MADEPTKTPETPEDTTPDLPAAAPEPAPDPWSGLEGEDLGLVQTKGWKTPAEALESYRRLESFRGVPEDQLLRIPRVDDEEGWQALHQRLAPQDLDDYGKPEEDEIDLRELARDAGLTVRQANSLKAGLAKLMEGRKQESVESLDAQAGQAIQELQGEWGKEYDRNMVMAQQGTKWLGWDQDTVNALMSAKGARWVFDQAFKIGSGLGEHGGPLDEGDTPHGLTQEAARYKYNQLNADPEFQKRLQHPDRSVRLAAAEERARYNKIGWPE